MLAEASALPVAGRSGRGHVDRLIDRERGRPALLGHFASPPASDALEPSTEREREQADSPALESGAWGCWTTASWPGWWRGMTDGMADDDEDAVLFMAGCEGKVVGKERGRVCGWRARRSGERRRWTVEGRPRKVARGRNIKQSRSTVSHLAFAGPL